MERQRNLCGKSLRGNLCGTAEHLCVKSLWDSGTSLCEISVGQRNISEGDDCGTAEHHYGKSLWDSRTSMWEISVGQQMISLGDLCGTTEYRCGKSYCHTQAGLQTYTSYQLALKSTTRHITETSPYKSNPRFAPNI